MWVEQRLPQLRKKPLSKRLSNPLKVVCHPVVTALGADFIRLPPIRLIQDRCHLRGKVICKLVVGHFFGSSKLNEVYYKLVYSSLMGIVVRSHTR